MEQANGMLARAGDWFLHSGIQEPQGGVARYYRSDASANAPVSTEITGYAVSFLVYLHQVTGDATGDVRYLDAARRAARFLTRHAWDPHAGLFPFEHSFNGWQPKPLAYFFDSGIIVRGLLALWRVCGETEFLGAAIAAGRGMLAHFAGPRAIHPILALPDRRPLAYEPRWSAEPGCYQLKSAMAWHDLFEVTGDAAFQSAYESALAGALETHRAFLPGSGDRAKVMDRLHAYAYFLEGLLPRAQRADCAAALRFGLDRAAALLREIEPEFARSDVYAQVLRARLFADHLGVVALDSEAAAHEAAQAATFQYEAGDARLQGGFGFGRLAGAMLPFANPVSTAFCAQAIQLWCDRQANRSAPNRHTLV